MQMVPLVKQLGCYKSTPGWNIFENKTIPQTVKHSRHFPSHSKPQTISSLIIFQLLQVYALLCVISQYQEYQAGRGTADPYDPCKVRSTWQALLKMQIKDTMPKYLYSEKQQFGALYVTAWTWSNNFSPLQSYHKTSIMCLSARIPATYHETTNSPPGNNSTRLQSSILADEFPSPLHKQRRGSNRHVQFGSFDDVKSKMASKAFGKFILKWRGLNRGLKCQTRGRIFSDFHNGKLNFTCLFPILISICS